MSRIDRYVSFLFWGYFLGAILVFVTLFTAIDAMSMMVTYRGVPMTTFLEYYSYATPDILHKMLPVSCLLATVLTLSNMNKSSELIALYATGMSLFRICRPVLFWVLLLSVAGYILSDRALPIFAKNKNYLLYNEIKKDPTMFSIVKTDRIWYRSKNSIFNIKTLNAKGDQAQGLTLYFFSDSWNLLQMMTASKVQLNGPKWELQNGSVTVFTSDSSFPLTSQFKNKTITMGEEAKDLQSSGQTSDMLNQNELSHFIKKNKEAGLDTVTYEVDYHGKFGFAFAGLVMVFLGIPFSVGRNRSGGAMMNIGICIGLVFIYWIFYSSAMTLGSHGALPPVVAAWSPNVIMTGLGVFLLLRLNK